MIDRFHIPTVRRPAKPPATAHCRPFAEHHCLLSSVPLRLPPPAAQPLAASTSILYTFIFFKYNEYGAQGRTYTPPLDSHIFSTRKNTGKQIIENSISLILLYIQNSPCYENLIEYAPRFLTLWRLHHTNWALKSYQTKSFPISDGLFISGKTLVIFSYESPANMIFPASCNTHKNQMIFKVCRSSSCSSSS
ncbi:unnamed protein product [Lactuca saligna]|uniref:Uncharacterized protein n=1 Tax=Lactuca saligna TaxID=75948 RepID=A0AA36E2Z7_LACSI|nr:unnamed protein product [Lactuca saligna]